MPITKKAKTSVSRDIEKREPFFMVGGVYIGKQYGGSSKGKKKKERERELPYALAILLVGIHPRKQKHHFKKMYVHYSTI